MMPTRSPFETTSSAPIELSAIISMASYTDASGLMERTCRSPRLRRRTELTASGNMTTSVRVWEGGDYNAGIRDWGLETWAEGARVASVRSPTIVALPESAPGTHRDDRHRDLSSR